MTVVREASRLPPSGGTPMDVPPRVDAPSEDIPSVDDPRALLPKNPPVVVAGGWFRLPKSDP